MKYWYSIVTFVVFLVMSPLHSAEVVGTAYDLKSGEVLYTETHVNEAPFHKVIYRQPDGEVFANKVLDYRAYSHAPAFEQKNQLLGEVIRTQVRDGMLTLTYLASHNAEKQISRFPVTSHFIVDAGFDQYVKANWSALKGGQRLDIDYLVPSRGEVVAFSLGSATCKENTQATARCFAITPKAWWLRMIVSPIVVAYDDTPRLVRFTGRGNIANADGNYQSVDIVYQYED